MFGDYAYGGTTVLSLVKLDAPAVANRMEIGEGGRGGRGICGFCSGRRRGAARVMLLVLL